MTLRNIVGRYKRIKGFDDYFISEFGDVYSIRKRGAEITPKLRKLKPKNPGKKEKYLNIILCKDGCQVTKSIHRLVAEHFVEGYFEGAVVNHIDGNNRNNNADNLEWVTTKENIHKSYVTSNKDATRNYKIWELYDINGACIGRFVGHIELSKFIVENKLDCSASSIVKHGKSRGYKVIKYC